MYYSRCCMRFWIDGPALLQLTVGDALATRVEPEASLDAVEVDSTALGSTPARARAARRGAGRTASRCWRSPPAGRSRGEPCDRAVQEHHVLDVEHQFLGHPGAVAEQRLDDALDLLHQLVAGERRRSTAPDRARGRGPPCADRFPGRAPRSRSASIWPLMSFVVAAPSTAGTPTGARRRAARRCRSRSGRPAVGSTKRCRRAGRRGRCRGSSRLP